MGERTPQDDTTEGEESAPQPDFCGNKCPGPRGEGRLCTRQAGHDGQHVNNVFRWEFAPPDDTAEPTATEDRYWQAEAQRARAERDALALRVLRLADGWEKDVGESEIRADVAAYTIRSAVKTMRWP